jgi:hypothetical protein
MLRTSIRDQSDWDSLLPYIQFAYNSAVQSSLGETPHFLNYTRDPIMPDSFEEEPERNSSIDTADELFFSKWQKALESAREALITAQGKQKKYYDKNKKIKKINAGDRILLRNMRLSNKLDRKWLGPYIVTRTLGTTNCAIQLEQGSKVEMVVHLNRIKLFPNRENLAEKENFEISESDDSNTISETESEEELPSHNRKTKKNRKPNLPHKNRKTKKKNSDKSVFEDSSTITETESDEEQTPNERKRNHNRKTQHPNQNTKVIRYLSESEDSDTLSATEPEQEQPAHGKRIEQNKSKTNTNKEREPKPGTQRKDRKPDSKQPRHNKRYNLRQRPKKTNYDGYELD